MNQTTVQPRPQGPGPRPRLADPDRTHPSRPAPAEEMVRHRRRRLQGRHAAGRLSRTAATGGGVATLTEERPAPAAEASCGRAPAEVAGAYFAELPVGAITPNPRQPRQVFEEEAMAELVHSVKEIGLLQPIVVRRTGDSSYELIMGERRWRATQEAGLETIPAIVRQTDDEAMLRDALLENLHRAAAQPAGGGGGLPAAARRLRLHPRRARRPDRAQPSPDQQHPAAAEPLACRPASRGRRRASAQDTPAPCSASPSAAAQDRLAGRVVSEGISVRGLEELVAVGEHGEDGRGVPQCAPAATRRRPA